MRKINKLIIHCSATPEGRHVEASEIEKWHLQRGFLEIGYHFLVWLDGTVEVGRDLRKAGAHCKDHNFDSIGICYVGGTDKTGNPKDTRTEAQKAGMRKLLDQLLEVYPEATIHGHNEFANKACPCFDVAELKTIRS